MNLEEAIQFYTGHQYCGDVAFVIQGMPDVVGLSQGPDKSVVIIYRPNNSPWTVSGASVTSELGPESVFSVSREGPTVIKYSSK